MKPSKAGRPAKVSQILLVDDNQNGLLARKSVLQEHGYVVHACAGPEEALAEFNTHNYDLVVTDYRMPMMTGAELIHEIRTTHPALPIVLISGVVDVLGLNEQSTGADVVIPKNATEINHLLRAVKRLLETSAPRKPVRSQTTRSTKKVTAKGT